jgi:DNA-binding beta-propeller fold protein YncE
MQRIRATAVGVVLAALGAVASGQPAPEAIPVPGGQSGVGFDDLAYSEDLHRVIVPAAGTGSLLLVNPGDWRVEAFGGLSEKKTYQGGHDDGVTSADAGRGFLFAIDRTGKRLLVIQPEDGHVAATARLAGSPDYVRFVAPTGEVWVTEPDDQKIEVFRLEGNPPAPIRDGTVEVPGGPEALVVDVARQRAYSNLWKGTTVAISLRNRAVAAKWPNGCEGSRGLALDPDRGFLFVGCAEGAGVTLDAKTGKLLSRLKAGNGVDVIVYSPRLRHLYLPGGKSATLSILSVGAGGALALAGEVPTASGGHCATADESGHVYVCDPHGGKLLVIPDLSGE